MNNKKNKKGFTLVELLVALIIMAIVTTCITYQVMFGYESLTVYGNITIQQDKIQQAIKLLKKDISDSRDIKYTFNSGDILKYIDVVIPDYTQDTKAKSGEISNATSNITKRWMIKNNTLIFIINPTGTAGDKEQIAVSGIKSDGTNPASYISFKQDSIVISILPMTVNTGKYQGSNIKEPITTQISVRYKNKT